MVLHEVKGDKIKLVIDHRRKIFATFIAESYEDIDEYVYVSPEEILKLADEIRKLREKHYRSAEDQEIDDIAYHTLEAVPIEE